MSGVNIFKVFQFTPTKYNRIKLHKLIYGIIFAVIFDFNLVQSLSVLEQSDENSRPVVFTTDDLPHLSDPEIQRELSQSFLKCSTKCSTLTDCLGVTIYKLNPPVSGENKLSGDSANNFICKTTLVDELGIEENSGLPKLGTVFYKIMFRDKLPKFQRRKFTVPHSRSLDGETEKLMFTSSETKREKRDLSSGLPNEGNLQSATVSPQIKVNDGNEENLIPAEPSSGQNGNEVVSPGNISETNATTTVTVKPSVLLQPENETDSIFHEQNVTPSKTISSVTLQPEINTLFENETTTAKSISEPTPDMPNLENDVAPNSTEKINKVNEIAESGTNISTPATDNKALIVNNSSLQETTQKESEGKIVVILPPPEENFSEDISPTDNTRTESSTEGTVVIIAPADHVFLSNNSNVIVSDTVPDDSENEKILNSTEINLVNGSLSLSTERTNEANSSSHTTPGNNTENNNPVQSHINSEASVTEANSIILGPEDDSISNDVDDTATPSVTEKSPALDNSIFQTTENIFADTNSGSDTAKSVTENSAVIFSTEKDIFSDSTSASKSVTESSAVIFPTEKDVFAETKNSATENSAVIFTTDNDIFSNTNSPSENTKSATENSAVIFTTDNDIFSNTNSPSETTKSATENSAVIFSTENDIFSNTNSPSKNTKSATENSAVIFPTENDVFNDSNLLSLTTESVTEKNSVIFPGEGNVFSEGSDSSASVPVENATENNAIIFAGTDNIFDENNSSPVTVDSVTENNSISTENVFSDDNDSALDTTESVTASSNAIVLDSTGTSNIFNDDNSSSATTESVTENNRIIFSTEKNSIFDEDTESPSPIESVTASNEILLGSTENIFADFNSTTTKTANPSEIITSTSTEKFLPPFESSDDNISPGIIPDINQWGNDTQTDIENLKTLPENYSPSLTANNSQLVPSATSKINSEIRPTSIPSPTNIQSKNNKKLIKGKGVGNKDKSKITSVGSTKSKGQSNKNPSVLHINFSTNIKIKKRGNETSITKIDNPSNVTVTYKKKIVTEKIPGSSSTVKAVKLSTSNYTVAEMNSNESSAGVTTSSDLGCSFQDSERYIRNIKSSSFSMLGGEETMLTFVSGVQSHCVSTLTRNGKEGIRSIESILTGFPLDLEVEAAGFVNEHVYIVDASGQNVWDFKLDNMTNLYSNVPMKIPPHESTKERFLEICQIEPDVDIQIKAFLQIHDKSCILFDESRTPITSKSANEDTRDLAEAISFLLETEFINYVESVFAWLGERFISSVYVYGSNGELYKLYRNASTEFKWRKGKYELLEYSVLPLQN